MQPEPYKKGWVEFYKLKFKVTPDVLIPRPETELLVDEVIKSIIKYNVLGIKGKNILVLDIGTGAGNIAISLACNPRGCNINIIASDISPKALDVAKQNAKLHGVKDKIKFIQSNLFGNPIIHNTKYITLIIVTNLPYIPSFRIPYLDCSVKDFEPLIALDGGEDGFELYRKLFHQIQTFSFPPRGWKPKLIIGEIDYTQGELAILEAKKYFPQAEVKVKKDLAHKQRILLIRQ